MAGGGGSYSLVEDSVMSRKKNDNNFATSRDQDNPRHNKHGTAGARELTSTINTHVNNWGLRPLEETQA
eukprot:2681803-Pyramimonas_sp.AAC.1